MQAIHNHFIYGEEHLTASATVERLPVALVRDRQESLVGLHDARQFRILQRIAYRVQHLTAGTPSTPTRSCACR